MGRWYSSRMKPGRWSKLPMSVSQAQAVTGRYRSSWWSKSKYNPGNISLSQVVKTATRPYNFVKNVGAPALAAAVGERAYALAKRVYKTKYRGPDKTKYKRIDFRRQRVASKWFEDWKFQHMK